MLQGGSHALSGRAQRFRWAHSCDTSNSTHEIDQPSPGCCEPSARVTLAFLDAHFYRFIRDVVRPGRPAYGIDRFGKVYCSGLTTVMVRAVVNAADLTM
jgi:hypothetical protein